MDHTTRAARSREPGGAPTSRKPSSSEHHRAGPLRMVDDDPGLVAARRRSPRQVSEAIAGHVGTEVGEVGAGAPHGRQVTAGGDPGPVGSQQLVEPIGGGKDPDRAVELEIDVPTQHAAGPPGPDRRAIRGRDDPSRVGDGVELDRRAVGRHDAGAGSGEVPAAAHARCARCRPRPARATPDRPAASTRRPRAGGPARRRTTPARRPVDGRRGPAPPARPPVLPGLRTRPDR